mgnify:CR=1 FL=1
MELGNDDITRKRIMIGLIVHLIKFVRCVRDPFPPIPILIGEIYFGRTNQGKTIFDLATRG